MTDSHTTPEAATLVAVDIAKDHNEVEFAPELRFVPPHLGLYT